MADKNVDKLIASLVETLVNSDALMSGLTEADYQALLHCICPDLFHDISQEDLQIARENFAKVYKQLSQPAPVEQDNHGADALEERISDVSGNLFDLDLNKAEKGEELEHYYMVAPEELVEQTMVAPKGSVEGNKAVLEGPVEQKTAAPEETVKDSATSEETVRQNMVAPEETVECDTASQKEEAAESNTIAPEETVEDSMDPPEGEEGCLN